MRTVALRFADNFAPESGTIAAHQKLIDEYGCAWYGKLGSPIAIKVAESILSNNNPRILLIHSGKADRWWAHIRSIQREVPELELIPAYYRDYATDFKCWLKIVRLEKAADNVVSRCIVASSNKPLTLASRHSMSPYFIIDYQCE